MNSFLITLSLIILFLVIWAVFSKDPGEAKDTHGPDKLFRRRAADKEIEEKFPADEDNKLRRKSDVPDEKGSSSVDEEFKLPYLADEIISDTSRFRVFKRTLINSEIYAKKGDFATAISLYQGVNNRISDQDVNYKIESNIKYLKEYRKVAEEKLKEAGKKRTSENRVNEIRLSLDGPLKIPEKIQIAVSPQGFISADNAMSNLENIAEQVTRKILGKNKSDDAVSAVENEIKDIKSRLDQIVPAKSGESYDGVSGELQKYDNEIKDIKAKLGQIGHVKSGESYDQAFSNELQKYDNEISKLKDKIDHFNKISDNLQSIQERALSQNNASADGNIQPKEETKKLLEERDRLLKENLEIQNEHLKKLKEFSAKDKLAEEESRKYQEETKKILEERDKLIKEKENIQVEQTNKIKEYSDIKSSIEKLYDKLQDLGQEDERTKKDIDILKDRLFKNVPDADQEPSVMQAKFQSGQMPRTEIAVPAPKQLKFPKVEQEPIDFKREHIQKSEEEVDGPEQVEVIGEDKKVDALDDLTDNDIFDKILKDEFKRKDNPFEIFGYKKDNQHEFEYTEKDFEDHDEKDQDFYRTLLKHSRSGRKELPILKVTYDFSKLPEDFNISSDKNMLQYSFYKFKPMLERANELIKVKNVRDAINYYETIRDQTISPEFKAMLNQNIKDLTDYIEKYLSSM